MKNGFRCVVTGAPSLFIFLSTTLRSSYVMLYVWGISFQSKSVTCIGVYEKSVIEFAVLEV